MPTPCNFIAEDDAYRTKLVNQDAKFQQALAKAIKLRLEQMPRSMFEKRSKCQEDRLRARRNIVLRFAKKD